MCVPMIAAAFAGTDTPYACTQFDVVDTDGAPVLGIEDIALDERYQRLVLSAYDRFAVMAAQQDGTALPGGGLYSLPVEQLERPGPFVAQRLPFGENDQPLIHPHGIGLYDDVEAHRLAVVNRYSDTHDASAATLMLFDISEDDLSLVAEIDDPLACRANDIALIDATTAHFTYDQGSCGALGVWLERIFSPSRSGLRRADFAAPATAPETVVEGLAFANGVVLTRDRRSILVSASRDRVLRRYAIPEGDMAWQDPEIILGYDGGPDNVSVADDGRIITAVHPAPFALFLHMNKWGPLPHSRVVIAQPDGSDPLIIDGSKGQLPGAATSAVEVGDVLVVSSAWDEGLGICRPSAAGGPLKVSDAN